MWFQSFHLLGRSIQVVRSSMLPIKPTCTPLTYRYNILTRQWKSLQEGRGSVVLTNRSDKDTAYNLSLQMPLKSHMVVRNAAI